MAQEDASEAASNKGVDAFEKQPMLQRLYHAFLKNAAKMSGPERQILTQGEDSVQTLAGLTYTLATPEAFSPFIIATSSVSAVKIILTLAMRPYLLCWMADEKLPWQNVSASDVKRAMRCYSSVGAMARATAAKELLSSPLVGTGVWEVATLELCKMYGRNRDVSKEWRAEANFMTVRFARDLQHDVTAPAAREALKLLGYSEQLIDGFRLASKLGNDLSDGDKQTQTDAAKRLEQQDSQTGMVATVELMKALENDITREAAAEALRHYANRSCHPQCTSQRQNSDAYLEPTTPKCSSPRQVSHAILVYSYAARTCAV